MSIKLSSLLKLSVASAVLLSVGACKATDKGQGALKSESVAALNLSKSESGVFSKYFETASCDVDELESLGALAGLGMGENGANGVSFDSREVKGGVVTYSGLKQTFEGTNEAEFTAGTLVFHCPKMVDDAPNFTRLDVKDLRIRNEADGHELTAETLNFANPTDGTARVIVESFGQLSESNFDSFEFGAFSVTGMEIKSTEMNGTINAISWGETRDENGKGTADLSIDDVNFLIPDQQGAGEISINFDGMSARNLNIGVKNDADPNLSPEQVVSSLFDNIKPFDKPYDELIVESLKINSEFASLDFAGLEGITSEKGDVITTTTNLKPAVINLKPRLGEIPSFLQGYAILQSLDMETISISGSSVSKLDAGDDSASVSNGLFVIDDVMRLNFEYEAEGINAILSQLKQLETDSSAVDSLEFYNALKLRNFRMTIEDNSIVDKGLTLATQMTGQSEAQLKLMVTGAVFLAASQAKNEFEADVYSKTMEALANFIKKGGTLTIEANPPEPFSFAPLISGEADNLDPATLGFSASQAN